MAGLTRKVGKADLVIGKGIKMSSMEKAESLKNAIYQLYVNEGRSKSYISRLLEINRKTLAEKIKEWDFPEPRHVRHANPSTEKFIKKNRTLIKARLDSDVTVTDIAKELGVNRSLMRSVFYYDEILKKANEDRMQRIHNAAQERIEGLKENSSLDYYEGDLPGEEWREILGYPDYMVSNKGRIRSYAKRYKSWYLRRQYANEVCDNRLYVILSNGTGRQKSLSVARIVAHAFVSGFSETRNTVNHIDGDVQNNDASNLEWVSQEENNIHAYRVLKRRPSQRRRKFSKIILNDKYEFKTIRALAKFMGISETQASRYLDEPHRHGLKMIA